MSGFIVDSANGFALFTSADVGQPHEATGVNHVSPLRRAQDDLRGHALAHARRAEQLAVEDDEAAAAIHRALAMNIMRDVQRSMKTCRIEQPGQITWEA